MSFRLDEWSWKDTRKNREPAEVPARAAGPVLHQRTEHRLVFTNRCPFDSIFAPPAVLERAAGTLPEAPLIQERVPIPAPASVRHSPQPDCPRSYHYERAQKLSAVALDGMCNQSSLGGRRPSGQPNENDAGRAMMLSEDKLSEVLVVGDENVPGLGCSLQYRGVGATGRQLGRVNCGVTE